MHQDHCQSRVRLLWLNYKYKNHRDNMKQITLRNYFPYNTNDVFDLIMDISTYPQIYALVKSVRLLDDQPRHRDIELELNLSGPFILGGKHQTARVTGIRPQGIQVTGLAGPMKTLNMNWVLSPARDGGTHLEFIMEYESGRGRLVDMGISGFVSQIVNDTLRQFGDHVSRTLVLASGPAAGRASLPSDAGRRVPVKGRKPE